MSVDAGRAVIVAVAAARIASVGVVPVEAIRAVLESVGGPSVVVATMESRRAECLREVDRCMVVMGDVRGAESGAEEYDFAHYSRRARGFYAEAVALREAVETLRGVDGL